MRVSVLLVFRVYLIIYINKSKIYIYQKYIDPWYRTSCNGYISNYNKLPRLQKHYILHADIKVITWTE